MVVVLSYQVDLVVMHLYGVFHVIVAGDELAIATLGLYDWDWQLLWWPHQSLSGALYSLLNCYASSEDDQ